MSKGLKVTIQTKPYLKKYLHKLYGDPLRFSTDNEFGICIAAFLHRPVSIHDVSKEEYKDNQAPPTLAIKSQDRKDILKMRLDTYDAFIDVHLPQTFLTKRRGGFEIKDQHVIILNKMFEKKFEADVWRLCTVMSVIGVEKKDALAEVADSYDIVIDEDISMDALVQKEFRYRKKMELSAPELSSEFVKNSIKKLIFHNVRNGNRHT